MFTIVLTEWSPSLIEMSARSLLRTRTNTIKARIHICSFSRMCPYIPLEMMAYVFIREMICAETLLRL
ncbi:hypothetical protein CW706_04470 [Candidatus Bathyarchaeota archaeon]|nr:MAG: hypothetical protein CW706_04470 [Candidatus Bathyarchaeota archaeon]